MLKTAPFGLACAALGAALVACAPVPPAARSAAADTIIDTRADAAFGDATAALAALLAAATPAPVGTQNFCVVGYRSQGGDRFAWVHWREGRQLIFWQGQGDPAYAAESIVHSRRKLDLDRDVVETEAEVAGSTYLVTRAWIDARLADCTARGTRYSIAA